MAYVLLTLWQEVVFLLERAYGRKIRILGEGANTMKENNSEVYEQEMIVLGKIFTGFLFGLVAILSMWLLSGLYYVILK